MLVFVGSTPEHSDLEDVQRRNLGRARTFPPILDNANVHRKNSCGYAIDGTRTFTGGGGQMRLATLFQLRVE